MNKVWQQEQESRAMTAPLSLIVSAFSPLSDVRLSRTPELMADGETVLLLIDLGRGQNRLGGSALAQVHGQSGSACPDIDNPEHFAAAFNALQELFEKNIVLACHDRSDGGLVISALEMAFAANTGVQLNIDSEDAVASLFAEELGWLIQVRQEDVIQVKELFSSHGVADMVSAVGALQADKDFSIAHQNIEAYKAPLSDLRRQWWQTSFQMQSLRDNPESASQEFELQCRDDDPGISPLVTFDIEQGAPAYNSASPKVAILREQGVNGHIEMAAAFYQAGFESVDVHMTDILGGRVQLSDFIGLVACGGFSYGDVLGAGAGWASTVLYNERARDQFQRFFQRQDTFALGVCNGCQMFSHLSSLIPGASHWPKFGRNTSEQFEARLSSVIVEESPSVLLQGMAGSVIPVAVAHGEGRATAIAESSVTLRYVDNYGAITESYPHNPNGSAQGVTGLCSIDGRFNIMMPHPERVFRTAQYSWHPSSWKEHGPWMNLFHNARRWVG